MNNASECISVYLQAQWRLSHATIADDAKEIFVRCKDSGHRTRMLKAPVAESCIDEQGVQCRFPTDLYFWGSSSDNTVDTEV